MNLSITACSFYIKKSNGRTIEDVYFLNDKICLDDTKGSKIDIEKMFCRFAKQYNKTVKDDKNQKTFSCQYIGKKCFSNDKYRCLTFKITSGHYGNTGKIKDIDTTEIKYQYKSNESVTKDFYMFVVIPKDNPTVHINKGMIIFQNIGNFGAKTITTQFMRQFFAKTYNITIVCSTIAPSLYIQKVLAKQNVTQMIMIRNHKSDLSEDNYDYGYGTESRVISDIRFSDSVWHKIQDQIIDFAYGRTTMFEFQDQDYDKLKMQIRFGDGYRTIDLHNIEKLSIIESIPNNIKNSDGNADIDKLIKYIEKVILDYMKEMVLEMT